MWSQPAGSFVQANATRTGSHDRSSSLNASGLLSSSTVLVRRCIGCIHDLPAAATNKGRTPMRPWMLSSSSSNAAGLEMTWRWRKEAAVAAGSLTRKAIFASRQHPHSLEGGSAAGTEAAVTRTSVVPEPVVAMCTSPGCLHPQQVQVQAGCCGSYFTNVRLVMVHRFSAAVLNLEFWKPGQS